MIDSSAQDILPKVDVIPKHKSMTKDILAKMGAKPNTDIYKQLNQEIKREGHATKERMLTE